MLRSGCVPLLLSLALLCVATGSAHATPPSKAPERTDGAIDTAIVQAINGAAIGAMICEAGPQCWQDEVQAAHMLGGAAVGGLTGYLVGGMMPRGQAMTLNTGTLFGGFVGAQQGNRQWRLDDKAHNFDSNDPFPDQDEYMLGYTIGGELIGGAIGGAIGIWLDPEPARVSLANSAGGWALLLAALADSLRTRSSIEGATVPPLAMATVFSLGFAGGWALWSDIQLPRGAVWKIDLGGLLGLTAGIIYASNSNSRNNGDTKAVLTGTALGLGVGTWLALRGGRGAGTTAAQDDGETTVATVISPLPGGGMLSLRGSF